MQRAMVGVGKTYTTRGANRTRAGDSLSLSGNQCGLQSRRSGDIRLPQRGARPRDALFPFCIGLKKTSPVTDNSLGGVSK